MKRVPWIVISKLLVNKAAELEDRGKYRFGSGQCSEVELLLGCRRTKRSRNNWQCSGNKEGAHWPSYYQGFLLPAAFHCINPPPGTVR